MKRFAPRDTIVSTALGCGVTASRPVPMAYGNRAIAMPLIGPPGPPGSTVSARNSRPLHAAGMPGHMTRTADTPSRPLRAQNQREASVTPSVGDNRRRFQFR